MATEYTIVREANGYRVVWATGPAMPSDQPQHRTEQAARQWAEEMLALEAKGNELSAAE
jgi:hypothetical protein